MSGLLQRLFEGVGVLTVGLAVILGVAALGSPESKVEAANDSVDIGNGIQRTDDTERGVTCYRVGYNAPLSCVVTGVK